MFKLKHFRDRLALWYTAKEPEQELKLSFQELSVASQKAANAIARGRLRVLKELRLEGRFLNTTCSARNCGKPLRGKCEAVGGGQPDGFRRAGGLNKNWSIAMPTSYSKIYTCCNLIESHL